MTAGTFKLICLQSEDQRGKMSFRAVQVRKKKIPGRHSDWLRLGHVPFPGPMAVGRGISYCDWPGSESRVQSLRSEEGGVLREVCWLVFACSWQRLSVVSSSLMAPCRTDTNIIPIHTVVQNRVEQPRYPWLLIQPVCVNARAWTQVCKRVSSTLRTTEDLWLINIYNLSKRNLCQTAGLLSRDYLLSLLYDVLQ